MKIIYHPEFETPEYAQNPAAARGRIRCIMEELENLSELNFLEPKPAEIDDLKLIHTKQHIDRIRRDEETLFEMASLAAGGAIEAAEIAYEGEPTFAVIRPPGHHASPDSCWGFCYFNNMSIAIEKLKKEGKIDSAYILDFDLHTGDGNINSLEHKTGIKILNPSSRDREDYLKEVEMDLEMAEDCDIIGVSAGFDQHIEDWGGRLTTADFQRLGTLLKDFSKDKCEGRRFGILEGGYNHDVLGKNVASFIKGFQNSP